MYKSAWCYNPEDQHRNSLVQGKFGVEGVIYEYGNAGVHKSRASGRIVDYVLYGCA
jgi:hypothetical protein